MIKLLHVEDDADIREIALMALELSGDFDVVQCETGEAALNQVQSYTPDVILLDMMMPGMTGRQTLEKMREMDSLRDVPAIFMTARAQHNEIEELRDLGAADVISKPFDPIALADQAQIPQAVLAGIGIDSMGPIGVLFVISIAFFIGCMFVDPIVVILVFVPIFAPVVDSVGLDPVLVGTVITLQVAIGSATPPFGCDIFTAIAVFKRPYMEVIRGTPPFIIMLLSVSVALIFFPQIALFLRDLAFAK